MVELASHVFCFARPHVIVLQQRLVGTDAASIGFQTKVSTSRSISMQSFDEALAAGSGNITSPASTPVIPEEKEIK